MAQYPEMKSDEYNQAAEQLQALRQKMQGLQRQLAGKTVSDYTLADLEGNPVQLSELFGDKKDLIVIHNMGRNCPYCTLWADGFNGIRHHLEDRASLVLVSADDSSTAADFAKSRGWSFRVLSSNGGPFSKDMLMESDKGAPWPGISTFCLEDDTNIRRISYAYFGPGDDFCSLWHIFAMLKNGTDGWEPKVAYD